MIAQPKPIKLPGDVLSPSSCTQYRRCPAQWRYRHIDHLPDPKTGALLVGSCLHAAIADNFRQKIETKRDLPAAGVQAIYAETWGTLIQETEFHPDEDPGELQALGQALTLKYLDEACPSIAAGLFAIPDTLALEFRRKRRDLAVNALNELPLLVIPQGPARNART